MADQITIQDYIKQHGEEYQVDTLKYWKATVEVRGDRNSFVPVGRATLILTQSGRVMREQAKGVATLSATGIKAWTDIVNGVSESKQTLLFQAPKKGKAA